MNGLSFRVQPASCSQAGPRSSPVHPQIWRSSAQPSGLHACGRSAVPATGSFAVRTPLAAAQRLHPSLAKPKQSGDSPNAQPKSGQAKGKAASAKAVQAEDEDEEVDDGFLDYGEDEGTEDGEAFEDFGSDEGDDDYAAELEPDDVQPGMSTGGTSWGEVALRCAQQVLSAEDKSNLELYLFRAIVPSKKLDIRLDKLDDVYGSPSIDDISTFSRALFAALELELGLEAAGDISFEVSSPGAERSVRVPDELKRFAGLPLKVEYIAADGTAGSGVWVMEEVDLEAGTSVWRLANVRANAKTKGRALSKKQLSERIPVPVASIRSARIFVDFN